MARKKKNAGPGSARKSKKGLTKLSAKYAGQHYKQVSKETKARKRALKKLGRPIRSALRNPLPIGKLVTVKARRRPDGKIDLFKAR